MTRILLTGAGFTRNWGGWLAAETFEYLLTREPLSADIRKKLWEHKDRGGFETTLGHYQRIYAETPDKARQNVLDLQAAVRDMFADMEHGLSRVPLETSGNEVATFLARFDAIFTLNLDLLLERRYFGENVSLLSHGKWDGGAIPGVPHSPQLATPHIRISAPNDTATLKLERRIQPYIKLHGSINWYDESNELMVIGAGKTEAINRHPFLKWNLEKFSELTTAPNAKLMTIGYGFGDEHINELIRAAVEGGTGLFIVDPRGVDVLSGRFAEHIRHAVIGASRRKLHDSLGKDHVEGRKFQAFFR